MTDYRPNLERARDRFTTPGLSLEGVYRRRDRHRRNQRLGAGALGIAIAILGIAIGHSILTSSHTVPAHRGPAPTDQERLRTAVFGLDGSLRQEVYGLPADAFGTQASADGTSVAFITRDSTFASCQTCRGTKPRLATMRLDGSDPRVVAGRWRWLSTPAWSPDGSRLAFAATRRDGNRDIFVVDADGSNLRRLTTDPANDSYPSWSPDGTTIIYDNAGGVPLDPMNLSRTQELWTVTAAGGAPTRLTHDHIGEKQAVYSPDGSQIAVSRGPNGIWVMDADGTNLRRVPGIPTYPTASFGPRWSPDGTKLAFLIYISDLRPLVLDPRSGHIGAVSSLPLLELNVVDLATHELTSLRVRTGSDVNTPSWLPNGDAILIDRFATR